MKGFKTLFFNAATAAVLAVLPMFAAYDWTSVVSPNVAMLIVTGINVALRFMTTGPVGASK